MMINKLKALSIKMMTASMISCCSVRLTQEIRRLPRRIIMADQNGYESREQQRGAVS